MFQISPYTVKTKLKINMNLEEKKIFLVSIKLKVTTVGTPCVCRCVGFLMAHHPHFLRLSRISRLAASPD